MEAELVTHLVSMAESGTSAKEFRGFEEEEAEVLLQSPKEHDSRVMDNSSPIQSPVKPKTQKHENYFKEGELQMLGDQIISKMAPMVKSLCVTERLLQVQVIIYLHVIMKSHKNHKSLHK